MQLNFFNTIHLSGVPLKQAKIQCSLQEIRILDIMQMCQNMTPCEVWKAYCYNYAPCPITSVRRAMTVLTEKGYLEKCEEMKEGIYGKPNHTWKKKIQNYLFDN